MRIRVAMRSGFYLEQKDWDEIQNLMDEILKIGERSKKIPNHSGTFVKKICKGSEEAQ